MSKIARIDKTENGYICSEMGLESLISDKVFQYARAFIKEELIYDVFEPYRGADCFMENQEQLFLNLELLTLIIEKQEFIADVVDQLFKKTGRRSFVPGGYQEINIETKVKEEPTPPPASTATETEKPAAKPRATRKRPTKK